ncbi:MAG: hypothetical protein R3D84_11465 [Paracoccaceae bacterium]
MLRPAAPFAMILGLVAACSETGAPQPAADLPLLGGYRDPADACQRVGESPETIEYLDHTADLVACPAGAENIGVFVTETGAIKVADLPGWELYSVPRG